jgi:CelD/BcsL family acetyltransferase involved in cellulose biosynthesis
MEVEICRPCELSATDVAKWHEFQQADESLQNPFLSFEFARAVDLSRPDGRVVVVHDGGDVVAFLPLSIARGSLARPIAPGFCNLQALISDPGWEGTLLDVFRRCKLNAYMFDYHLGAQVPGLPGVRRSQNWLVDLSEGHAGYFGWREEHHPKYLGKLRGNIRRLERETGRLELRFDTASASDLQALMGLKAEQCLRLGWRDIAAIAWVRKLADNLLSTRTPWLTGTVTTLVTDECIIAADFSLRSSTVFAGWLMAYNTAFEKRSPGLLCLYRLIEDLSDSAMRYIDLGKGVDQFKQLFSNGTVEVAEGSLTSLRPLGRLAGAASKASYTLRTGCPVLETKAREYVREWRRYRTRASG